MARIRVKLRLSAIGGRRGTIYYQVSHRSVVRQITTNIHLLPSEWDATEGRIVPNDAMSACMQNRIDSDLGVLQRIVGRLEGMQKNCNVPFTADDIVVLFRNPCRFVSVIGFLDDQIRLLSSCGRRGTASNYRRAYNSLECFLDGCDLQFSEVTSSFVDRYGDFLTRRGLCRNSISFHMRILRAVYNKAVRQGIVEQTDPFRNAYTGIDHTRKRAVGQDIISRITRLTISGNASRLLAKDMFMFSFYTRGMSFVDMAFLRKTDVQDGVICYIRHKTGQCLSVKIEPCMQEIIDRYAGRAHASPYVFPVLQSSDDDVRYYEYTLGLRRYNRQLGQIARMLGLAHSLSSYTSRHSWATIARNHDMPLAVISAGMGHTSERTTRIYLRNVDNAVVDNANNILLKKLDVRTV